jgi:hypothetical protein
MYFTSVHKKRIPSKPFRAKHKYFGETLDLSSRILNKCESIILFPISLGATAERPIVRIVVTKTSSCKGECEHILA